MIKKENEQKKWEHDMVVLIVAIAIVYFMAGYGFGRMFA